MPALALSSDLSTAAPDLASLGWYNLSNPALPPDAVIAAVPEVSPTSLGITGEGVSDLAGAAHDIDMSDFGAPGGWKDCWWENWWLPWVATDFMLFGLDVGVGPFNLKLSIQSLSVPQKLVLYDDLLNEIWRQSDTYVIGTLIFIRVYVHGSTPNLGTGDWDNDGIVKIWMGPNPANLVLVCDIDDMHIPTRWPTDLDYDDGAFSAWKTGIGTVPPRTSTTIEVHNGPLVIPPVVGGLYYIHPDKATRHDSYYDDIEKKIPDPIWRTAFVGE